MNLFFSALIILICTLSCETKNTIPIEKKGSIHSFMKNIDLKIYIRTNVFFDPDGVNVKKGKVALIQNFKELKEYQLKAYDYVERIEIEGEAEEITLQFLNAVTKDTLHQEKGITLNGSKTYSTTDPFGQNKDEYYQDWLLTTWEGMIIKIFKNDNTIFEGKINPSPV